MSVSRHPVVLPESLRTVLEMRTKVGTDCPKDVLAKLQSLSYFGHKPAPAPAPTRFGNLGRVAPDGWRSAQHTRPVERRTETTEDGFEVWTNRKKQGGRSYAPSSTPAVRPVAPVASTAPSVAPPTGSEPTPSSEHAWKSSRFKPLEDKIATESTEDRIMGKVRSKINKIGESTYEPTKAFMQQILDSGNTEFLEEFMKFVFQKAATEPSFCGMYARLLHELADEFSHLRTEMQIRFREYTQIFVETEKTPDVGTEDYQKFVESQEKKKFRRGYSQFVAELAKLGEVNFADFRSLLESITTSLLHVYKVPDNILMCEEYVDCLSRMCHAGASMLRKEAWANEQIRSLQDIRSSPRSSSPGLSNKARFALMDLHDFVERGWK